jgi:hypothetical protein
MFITSRREGENFTTPDGSHRVEIISIGKTRVKIKIVKLESSSTAPSAPATSTSNYAAEGTALDEFLGKIK